MVEEFNSLQRHYNVDLNTVVELYKNNASINKISSEVGLGHMPVRTILHVLQLRLKNKHRQYDYAQLQLKLASNTEEQLSDLAAENAFLVKEVKKLKKTLTKLRLENRVNTKVTGQYQGIENILEQVLDSCQAKRFTPAKPVQQLSNNANVQCVLISDTHFGEIVARDEVPNNEYNYEVAKQRLEQLAKHCLTTMKTDRIHVFILGDIIQGIPHNMMNQAEGNFIESITQAVDCLTYFINILKLHYKDVYVHAVGGNHDRLTEEITFNKKYVNFALLVYKMCERLTNVPFNVSTTPFVHCYLNGALVAGMHGDTFRGYTPNNLQEVAKVFDVFEQLFETRPKHMFSGHLHIPMSCLNQFGGMCVVNGSLIGNGNYALYNGMRAVRPSQTIVTLNQHGDCVSVNNVLL